LIFTFIKLISRLRISPWFLFKSN